jgi:hypothetical protein
MKRLLIVGSLGTALAVVPSMICGSGTNPFTPPPDHNVQAHSGSRGQSGTATAVRGNGGSLTIGSGQSTISAGGAGTSGPGSGEAGSGQGGARGLLGGSGRSGLGSCASPLGIDAQSNGDANRSRDADGSGSLNLGTCGRHVGVNVLGSGNGP